MPLGAQLAQTVHAAGESALGPLPPETRAVVLAARDEAHLLDLERKALEYAYQPVSIREPDAPYNGQLMSIGFRPAARGAYKKLLSQLPLIR